MYLVYPGARSEAVEQIEMRALFDSLGDVELVAQCRYRAPKTLQESIETAQRMKDCRLASKRRQGRPVGHSSPLRDKKHR